MTLAVAFVVCLGAVQSSQAPTPPTAPPDAVRLPNPHFTSPQVLKSVRPAYTNDAKKAKIEGVVRLQVVVMPDGTVTEVHIVKSLDKKHGLDEEAIKAAKQWRFTPGTKDREPVPVQVFIELKFTLK